jgi:catechol 2,3-dioxygenase-like lactoylglutathione lyase family enzyme
MPKRSPQERSTSGGDVAGLGPSKLVAFVGVHDAERAKAFYQHVLGLPLVSEQLPFALVFDAGGTMLRVTIVPEVAARKYTVLGWDVPDVNAAVKRLRLAGVQFQRYEGMSQDDLGIWTAPSGAKIAWFQDPDGNVLSVTQF